MSPRGRPGLTKCGSGGAAGAGGGSAGGAYWLRRASSGQLFPLARQKHDMSPRPGVTGAGGLTELTPLAAASGAGSLDGSGSGSGGGGGSASKRYRTGSVMAARSSFSDAV